MNKALNHYECEGQLSIFDYQEPIYPLDIKGICDDAYCPQCGYFFTTWGQDNEIDLSAVRSVMSKLIGHSGTE